MALGLCKPLGVLLSRERRGLDVRDLTVSDADRHYRLVDDKRKHLAKGWLRMAPDSDP